jgi:hypothetical protein
LPFIFWHFPFSNFATFTILGCSFYWYIVQTPFLMDY